MFKVLLVQTQHNLSDARMDPSASSGERS
ncbi:hypothetical protein [Erythrobacter sp.]